MKEKSNQQSNQAYLDIIAKASGILNQERQTTHVLQNLLDCLIDNIPAASTGIIWIYKPVSGKLIAQNASGIDYLTLSNSHLNIENSLLGNIFQTGKIKFIKLPDTHEIFGMEIPGLNKPGWIACLPLTDGQIKTGILTMLFTSPDISFQSEEKLFWQIIANMITLVVKPEGIQGESLLYTEDTQQRKDELISILAHEMRTPLTSIKGYVTALLMTEISFSADQQKDFLEIIDRECDILQSFITDLLESSAIDSGAFTIDIEPIQLSQLAGEAVNEVARHSTEHPILIDFPEDFPMINADYKRIQQLFRHLLDNAIKYSPQGGLIIIQGRARQEDVIVSVVDEGIGIAPEDLNRLFDKYFRSRYSQHNQIIGTGLGLPISRSIIEAHGGHMWAESSLGHGSTFYFTLPYNASSEKI
jgi:signal transduction histidine kinase